MRIPFGTLTVTDRAKALVMSALDNKRLSCGQYVKEFEERFADKVGVKHAVAVSSGTDALALALAVLYDYGACVGNEVIIPALTFPATANAVLQSGFVPIFVDINRHTLNISPSKIEVAITENTVAIMPVHLMGKPADMDYINEIARRHNLFVIEDASEAHGAQYEGRNVGTIGNMGAFSLYIAHIISTVEGGIVTTDNHRYAQTLRSLRSHGRACKCTACVINTRSGFCKKRHDSLGNNGRDIRFMTERVGFSAKMNELEAAIGIGSIDEYENILNSRYHNLITLINELHSLESYFYTIEEMPNEKLGPHAFPIILKEGVGFTRNELMRYLETHGIETRDLFSLLPSKHVTYNDIPYEDEEFPEARYISEKGLHIGVHQDITSVHIEYIMNTLRRFVNGTR